MRCYLLSVCSTLFDVLDTLISGLATLHQIVRSVGKSERS